MFVREFEKPVSLSSAAAAEEEEEQEEDDGGGLVFTILNFESKVVKSFIIQTRQFDLKVFKARPFNEERERPLIWRQIQKHDLGRILEKKRKRT